MKRLFFTMILAFITVISVNSQSKKKKDIASIKDMCGCFEVTFNFAETFNFVQDSLYKPSENKVSYGLEWAELIVDENDEISIQHLLQVGSESKPYIVKHWRQDWLYENQDFYMFNGDNEWLYTELDKKVVDGQWTQKVYQVDDSPRYEGTGSWVHIDGKSYWESTTPAPLPRREYTKRSDYNLTMRGNRHEITSTGWVHDQDNKKIVRANGEEDVVIAHEKGYNIYKKVDDSRCQAAQDWWKEHNEKWATVRAKWDEVFNRNTDLNLHSKVDNKVLFKHLFDEDMTKKKEIESTIEAFVIK